jgi:hypothetical protein
MSLTLFEWDRYVGTHITPVDAVHNAREANQSSREYAGAYAAEHPPEEITTEELVNGMVNSMVQGAHNLATFRITGSPVLGPYSQEIFAETPENPDAYYLWVATADQQEIVDTITANRVETERPAE